MEKNRGIKRLVFALLYSWQGLRSALKHEEAFRQEFISFVALTTFQLFPGCHADGTVDNDQYTGTGDDRGGAQLGD